MRNTNKLLNDFINEKTKEAGFKLGYLKEISQKLPDQKLLANDITFLEGYIKAYSEILEHFNSLAEKDNNNLGVVDKSVSEISYMSFTTRKRLNLTQEELAKMLGCSNRSVSTWERGTCRPRFNMFEKIKDLYEQSKTVHCKIDKKPL